jgi:hypothetical protein
MTDAKTTRELVYETNRDVKWICKMLQRMEAQGEEFEARIRALERLPGGEGRGGTKSFHDQRRGRRGRRRGRRRGGGGAGENAWRGVRPRSEGFRATSRECVGSPPVVTMPLQSP